MGYLSDPKDGWFIPVSFHPTEDEKVSVEKQMRDVLEKLGPGFELPEINADTVQGEWQGGEGVVGDDSRTKETFTRLSAPTKNGPVVLMLHGGGHITGSPAMERTATYKLARMCQGRVFAVDFRLAPQHPFPAALVDAVLAYKYLIEPPPGAWHSAVDTSKLIIAGDSSGVQFTLNIVNSRVVWLFHCSCSYFTQTQICPSPRESLLCRHYSTPQGLFPLPESTLGSTGFPVYTSTLISPSPVQPGHQPNRGLISTLTSRCTHLYNIFVSFQLTTGVARAVCRRVASVPTLDHNGGKQ